MENNAIPSTATRLPKLHWYAYKGDVRGVLNCITEGCSLHETVSLRNQHGRLVCGITPLFLAAQRGHSEIVKLLVNEGASPVQPCFIQGSTELCTPQEVASLNLHFKLSRWLKAAAKARRKEDEVLALDDEDRMSQVSSRLARGLERARSVRSMGGGAGGNGLSLRQASRSSQAGGRASMSVEPALPAGPGSMAGGTEPGEAAEVDPQRQAALNFMQNIDLNAFDPASEAPVVMPLPAKASSANGMKAMFKKVFTWGGNSPPRDSMGAGAGANSRASQSTRVRGGPAGPEAPAAASAGVAAGAAPGGEGPGLEPGLDPQVVDPSRPDHTKVLQRFLKDLDLAHWQPESDGPLEGASTPARSVQRGPSPPRSLRGNGSPARSRA
ncbi:hypothetical protein HYH03_009766 [Edaphochlamys debaryana]|uniref:Uncharacterized protein n=1 Tax=Edaphochlamys debaryana TaxID=47281 RepID=A0A835XYN8_9CHLO|nr:hypothetical protein HYH03_009766 [Edaphochlamys debaryana]|eukprot:KAG2492037.1 hypothetical protein HYH03_009766 [Edaphochlamys debaryana]